MSKPYDATGKELLQSDPVAWAAFLGIVRPADRVKLVDSDLSTVSAAADKVLLIKDDPNWIANVEFLSWCDSGSPLQMLMYSGLLQRRHKMAVASVLVVLAPKADSPTFTGVHAVAPPFGPGWNFRYTVVRLWEMPVGPFLEGPLAILPLAPLADHTGIGLTAVANEIGRRLHNEGDFANGDQIVTMIAVLMKLRYNAMTTLEFINSIPDAEDYPGFKMFLDRGRSEGQMKEARSLLLRQGNKKFGPPKLAQESAINEFFDLAQLEVLCEKLLDVNTWDDLLND